MKNENVVVLDLETGGTNHKKDAICEIAMIVMDTNFNIKSRHEYLLRPHKVEEENQDVGRYRESAMAIHGITIEELEQNGRDPEKVAGEIALTFNGNDILKVIGHNVAFDIRFLGAFLRQYGYQISMEPICTLKMSKEWEEAYNEGIESFKLPILCEHFGIENKNAHRAMSDVEATLQLYRILSMDVKSTLDQMINEKEPHDWFNPADWCIIMNHENGLQFMNKLNGNIDEYRGIETKIDARAENTRIYLARKVDYDEKWKGGLN